MPVGEVADPLAISIEQPKADPFTTTNPVQIGIAGAKIRDASEVDQVEGDKVSTLEEVEVSLVNHNGEIIDKCRGCIDSNKHLRNR